MINKVLKKELNELKSIIAIETKADNKLSYGEVITFLVNHYKKSRRIEVPLEPKLFSGSSFKDPGLKIAYSLES